MNWSGHPVVQKYKSKHRKDPKPQRHGKSGPGCARVGLFREETENMMRVRNIKNTVTKIIVSFYSFVIQGKGLCGSVS